MKRKLLKYIKKLQSKTANKDGESVYKISLLDKCILYSISIFFKLSTVFIGSLIITLALFLLNYNFTIKNYLGSLGLYFIVYELKAWIDEWRNKE